MSPITTHILDTHQGCPAQDVAISLHQHNGADWKKLAEGKTDSDGRIRDLLAPGTLESGTYMMRFDVGDYHKRLGIQGFYPSVEIVFWVKDVTQHYHIPLLLSPFGYSTYRGS